LRSNANSQWLGLRPGAGPLPPNPSSYQRQKVLDVQARDAFPPGFAPIKIEGEFYWDGGLVSNTPLAFVLDDGLNETTLAIADLLAELPPEARDQAKLQKLCALGESHDVAIVHLVYRRAGYEGQDSDYEFSRRSMLAHWQAGSNDVHRTLRHPRLQRADDESVGMLVFDLAGDSDTVDAGPSA
jgi:NTE family protein